MQTRGIGRELADRSVVPIGMFSRIATRTGKNPSFPFLLMTLGFAAVIGLVLVFHVWSRLQVIDLGYALAASRTINQKLQQENRELLIELATLTSPERLESVARTRLGMRPAGTDEVVILP